MAMMIEQRAQLLQSLGSIGTSAADVAAEGIAEAVKTDSKTVETALKLFGGFDRSEFENINGQAPNLLVPTVRPPATYEAPAEYFKPLSNTISSQNLFVPAKDLLQQLEDPRFRMTDGLSGFSGNRITQNLTQKGIAMAVRDASRDSFGKLYRMENTVEKQLQLHEQLDIGAFSRIAVPKRAQLPNAASPKLEQGLKGLPDVQSSGDLKPPEILYTIEHALNATPHNKEEWNLTLRTLFSYGESLYFQGSMNDSQWLQLKESIGWIWYAVNQKYPDPELGAAAIKEFGEIRTFLKSFQA